MTYGTNPDGTDRTPEQWRAAVAELVLGAELGAYWFDGDSSVWRTAEEFPNAAYPMWRFRDGTEINASLFRPDLSADDARLVRDHVRDTWDVARKQRHREAVRRVLLGDKTDADWTFDFEPYMWASAALAVVESDAAVKAAKEN